MYIPAIILQHACEEKYKYYKGVLKKVTRLCIPRDDCTSAMWSDAGECSTYSYSKDCSRCLYNIETGFWSKCGTEAPPGE